MPQDPYVLVAELGDAEGELGRFDTIQHAMDAVDPDRELGWIQGGPEYIGARVGQAWFTAKRADR